MESDTLKMFGCPVCGFRVTESELACPRCNSKFGETTKFECPFCGELVDPKAKVCPFCHVDYDEFKSKTKKGSDANIDELLTEIIRLESMQVKQETKKFSCPDCSWLLDGTEGRCPKCGRDLSDEFAFQCPMCGTQVSQDALSCQECGANFETEETPSTPPESEPAISELEDFAASAKTTPPAIEPPKEPEAPSRAEGPAIEQPPQTPAETVAPAPPPQPQEVQEQAPERPTVKKTRKRKLKAKPSS